MKKQKSQRGKYKENFTNYLINNPLRIQQVSVKFQQDWRKYDIKMNSENWVVSINYQKLLVIFNYFFYKSVLT